MRFALIVRLRHILPWINRHVLPGDTDIARVSVDVARRLAATKSLPLIWTSFPPDTVTLPSTLPTVLRDWLCVVEAALYRSLCSLDPIVMPSPPEPDKPECFSW
jgi:hypothetical protein